MNTQYIFSPKLGEMSAGQRGLCRLIYSGFVNLMTDVTHKLKESVIVRTP
jgi:hypothetical protein